MPNNGSVQLAAFTCGRNVPSSRLRVRQHVRALRQFGIETTEYYPSRGSAHPTSSGIGRLPWLLDQLSQRYFQIKRARPFDVALLQRQLIATINTFESRIPGPRILDVDDAIWLTCRFHSVDKLAGTCETIICGNEFIAEHFDHIHLSVRVIPTAVDTTVWVPPRVKNPDGSLTIGWIGTHGNFKYLYGIEDSLAKVLRQYQSARLLIVSDAEPIFKKIPQERWIYRAWNEQTEVSHVQSMSIGIMPLTDSLWARGKCSCKLLQYMACGVPAVASPIGTNVRVAGYGGVLLAGSEQQWTDALLHLLHNESTRKALAKAGRSTVVGHYSAATAVADLARVIHKLI